MAFATVVGLFLSNAIHSRLVVDPPLTSSIEASISARIRSIRPDQLGRLNLTLEKQAA